ncbi:Axonemal dynein light chain domain-containing protein 1 [Liparis tanakae]|uniref:Axonemal dynein light chain domain-containing protein 1 n=1 Tax=Liparis tanakae TaxID=230148 RepID=A0A4Z2EF84_9TELE|nr:Axonemal dynein light chain domain-containing protein 1 [Liparis tanakae]
MRDHDASVSRQAERAQRQLAEALEQTHTNSERQAHGRRPNAATDPSFEVPPTQWRLGYQQLYQLHRGRLEARLARLAEDRDSWSRLAFGLALKGWLKSAEQCCLSLSLKVTKRFLFLPQDSDDLNTIMEFTDHWREQLTAFMSQMKRTERAQCEQIGAIQQGIGQWLAFCTAHHQ